MTLLKRKSALWLAGAFLLLDWVSGPLKTGAAQFSPSEKKRRTHPNGTRALSTTLGEAWETRRGREGGGGARGIYPVPIVATVQLHPSQQRRDYFYKASVTRQARQAKGRNETKSKKRKQKLLTAAEDRKRRIFFFSSSVWVTPTELVVVEPISVSGLQRPRPSPHHALTC